MQEWSTNRTLAEPDPTRQGFLTLAEVRTALEDAPGWEAKPHADLQVHTTDSDGSLPLRRMAFAARDAGRTFVTITDHSQSLRIANGMDPDRFEEQGREIDRLNAELEGQREPFRILRSMEMDVLADGSSDMPPGSLAGTDLVLGAFHSKLRTGDDQTARYIATLNNPDVQIIAHPRARMYGRRVGLQATGRASSMRRRRRGRRWSSTPRRTDKTWTSSSRGWPCAPGFAGSPSGVTPTPIRSSDVSPTASRPRCSQASRRTAC